MNNATFVVVYAHAHSTFFTRKPLACGGCGHTKQEARQLAGLLEKNGDTLESLRKPAGYS